MKKTPSRETTPNDAPLRAVKADYKAMYEAAKKTGKLVRPTFRIHTWTEDSAIIVGEVKGIKEFKEGKFDAVANAYLIETNDGAVSCVLGTYTDAQIKDTVKVGAIVAILFQGQKQLEDSRKVNMFDIDIIRPAKE